MVRLVCDRLDRHDCKLFDKGILLDANFIINIVEVLSQSIGLDRNNWRSQLDLFKTKFTEFLRKCCRCPSSDKVYTSDLVFVNEVDPTKDDSTIRRESRFFSSVAYNYYSVSRRFFSEILSIMRSKIGTISTVPTSLEVVKQSIRNAQDLSNEDISLIVSALIKSNEVGDTYVITADERLRDCLIEAHSLGNISFSSTTFVTNRLFPLTPYSYTSLLHRCCELSTDEQVSILRYFVVKDMRPSLSERIRRVKGGQVNETFKLLREHIRIKTERGY